MKNISYVMEGKCILSFKAYWGSLLCISLFVYYQPNFIAFHTQQILNWVCEWAQYLFFHFINSEWSYKLLFICSFSFSTGIKVDFLVLNVVGMQKKCINNNLVQRGNQSPVRVPCRFFFLSLSRFFLEQTWTIFCTSKAVEKACMK